MSCDTAVKLKLLILANQITHENISGNKICDKYPKLFTGIGKLKNYKTKLHIENTVTPAAIPHRCITFHLRQKVETELTYLEDNIYDIIEKVEGPNSWFSPVATPPKSNNLQEVRICDDMRLANREQLNERETYHPHTS